MGTSGPTRGPGKTAAKSKNLSPAQGAQQAEQRRDESDGREEAEPALELRHFELTGFGDDVFQLRARGLVAEDGGVDDACDRRRRARTFHLRFGKAPVLDEVCEAAHELAHADRDPVEVGRAFEEDGAREDAAEENRPHHRTAFLHVVEHGAFIRRSAHGWQGFGAVAKCF